MSEAVQIQPIQSVSELARKLAQDPDLQERIKQNPVETIASLAAPQIDIKAQIDILLKEYSTLRQEITERSKSRFVIFGYVGALSTFALSKLKGVAWPELFWPLSYFNATKEVVWPIVILAFTIVSLLVLWWRLGALIKACAIQISEIEQDVNKLAGANLLRWETRRREKSLLTFPISEFGLCSCGFPVYPL